MIIQTYGRRFGAAMMNNNDVLSRQILDKLYSIFENDFYFVY